LGGIIMGHVRRLLGSSPEVEVAREIQTLQADWIAENSDAREEGVFREEYERRILTALQAHKSDSLDPKKLLELAEAHGVLDPKDKKVLKYVERLCKFGDMFFDKQRQGDVYQLYGRSLFLAARFEECLEFMLKARECYKENGNRKIRRVNNTGLLRVYAAMGRHKECAERLEVALTQSEVGDDSMLLYMHAKNALEKIGTPRDAEILDDIWYVFLDTHPAEKQQWENFQAMGINVLKGVKNDDDDDDKRNLAENIATFWPLIKRDLQKSTFIRVAGIVFIVAMMMYVMVGVMKLFRK